MPDSTPISTSTSSTIDLSDYSALLEIVRVACHRIPNILTDELDISDDYLNQLEDIANALPSPVPTSPLEDENKELRTALTNAEDARTDLCCDIDILEAKNKELRLLAREALDTLRLMRDEASKGYAMIMSDREIRSRVCWVWDRLRHEY